MALNFNILTLFPEMFPGALGHSLAGKALERGDWAYNAINIRDYASGVHKSVDDTPFGGGAGMVLRPDVVENALLACDYGMKGLRDEESVPVTPSSHYSRIYLSPRGTPLTQDKVKDLSTCTAITLLCGRYEGVDQRVLDAHDFEEISIGDYVLSGGEPAALILMDAVIRLLPGVMGNTATPDEESFSNGLLEYPHYTRPAHWVDAHGNAHDVPDILQSGHHKNIADWRYEQSLSLTRERRPDLLEHLQEGGKKGRRNNLSVGDKDIDYICKEIVDAAIKVHKQLGPGLLEKVYEIFLFKELQIRGFSVTRQTMIPIDTGDTIVAEAFRADIIVENKVLIELKAVENQLPVHKAQVISYLKLLNLPVGFLINFNVPLLKDGLRRLTNQ